VFSFPQKAPAGAVTRNDMTAIEQLETWLTYQRHWCEHKPSITVSVRDDEWVSVGAFVFEHFDEMSGVSFLPHSDHTYQQAPYQETFKDKPVTGLRYEDGAEYVITPSYEDVLAQMPETIDWSKLSDYEQEDNTAGMQTMACSGDSCEIVDLT
jgi:ribonucleoside-triphosphate reductase